MAYAVSLGWAEDLPSPRSPRSAGTLLAKPSPTGMLDASWLAPDIVTARGEAWHVVGSLLGLGDTLGARGLAAALAEAARRRAEPQHGDRRWLVTTIAALDRRRFTDDAQRQLAAAVAAAKPV